MALYESSTWAWDGTVRSLYGASRWYAQTFTPQTTHDITSVILSLGRPSGDSPGEITVSIKATVSEKPSGDDLCSGTTTGNDLPELGYPTPAPEEREITFGTNPTLDAGTKYAIVVKALDGGSSDKVYWLAATSSVYADGDQCYTSDGGTGWTLYDDRELWFEEYGDLSLPGKPTTPTPANDASDITLHDTTGTWVSGGNTDSYRVLYGTLSGFLSEVGTTSDLSMVLVEGNFSVYGKISYWQVVAINENGTTPSDEWYFTTMNFAPVLPTGVTLDHSGGEGGVPTGTATGENNMITVRRLVAAARNKIFYEV